MAQVKLSNQIVTIRGRCGGNYFKTGDSQHIQAMPRVTRYTRTPAQTGNISMFSTMAVFWMLLGLAFWWSAWAAYALIYTISTRRRPSPHKITGYNWFIHYAMMFPEEERPPFWKPPHAPGDLPEYIITSGGRFEYYHEQPDWPLDRPADYFWDWMPVNMKPCYKDDFSKWFLWWNDPTWVVSRDAGFLTPGFTYYGQQPEIKGWYKNPDNKKRCHVYPGKHE